MDRPMRGASAQTLWETDMAYRKNEPNYVEANAANRALSVEALYAGIGQQAKFRAINSMYEEMREHDRKASELRNRILHVVENDMAHAGVLAPSHAYSPWFNFGKFNVATVIGPRHSLERTKSPSVDGAVGNVAALLAAMGRNVPPAPAASRLIKARGK